MTRVEGVDIYTGDAPLYATWVPVTWKKQVKVTKRNTRYNRLKDLTRTSKLLFFVACYKKETCKQHQHAFNRAEQMS
jgi:hypothetical protein